MAGFEKQVEEALLALTLGDLLELPSCAFACLSEFPSVSAASAGVDPVAIAHAPAEKWYRVDVDAFDGAALGLEVLLRRLREFGKILPIRGHALGVFEHGAEGWIIFLPRPGASNAAG